MEKQEKRDQTKMPPTTQGVVKARNIQNANTMSLYDLGVVTRTIVLKGNHKKGI